MSLVKQILKSKGDEVWTITTDANVDEALEMMAQKEVGALLVVDNQGKPAGIFSERDYARKVFLKGKKSDKTTVSEIMESKVLCIDLDQTVEECMAIMTSKRIRHLPVMDNGQLVGLISIGDVVKSIISEKDFVIQQLERYISGV